MRLLLLLFGLFSLIRQALAHIQSPYFPGYGFSWYDPVCGFACYNAISSAPLSCTSMDHSTGHSHGSGMTSPECRASDIAFLTTLAYCLNSTCDPVEVPTWQREKFWATRVTGSADVLPKWDYSRALEEVDGEPIAKFNASSGNILNETMLVTAESYEMQSRFMVMFDYLEMLQARYS